MCSATLATTCGAAVASILSAGLWARSITETSEQILPNDTEASLMTGHFERSFIGLVMVALLILIAMSSPSLENSVVNGDIHLLAH